MDRNLLSTRYSLESIPTNSYILSSINQIIDSNLPNLQEYTFVDFGSGSGRLVKRYML